MLAEFYKGATAEVVKPDKSQISHIYRRMLLKTVSWVPGLKEQ